MRIGILTTYFADYGSFAHATALYKFLDEKGYDCEIVNESIRYKHSFRLRLSNVIYTICPDRIIEIMCKKNTMFNNYVNLKNCMKDIRISKKMKDVSVLASEYDCILLGSDELWSVTNHNIRFIPEYFGIGIDIPIFSYATSGITLKNPKETLTRDMINGLKKFKNISVRDQITKKWIKDIVGIESKVVLDPALLNPYFVRTEKKDMNSKRYVLVYGETFSKNQIIEMKRWCKDKGLLMKSVVWKHNWVDENIEISSMEMLQQEFADAKYCFSSTFHGCIFSIDNKKQFTAFLEDLRGIKVKTLLENMDLANRIFIDSIDKCMENEIDYVYIDQRLKEERQLSEEYLINNIENIVNN